MHLTGKYAVHTIYNENKRHLFHAGLYFNEACPCKVWKYSKTSIEIKKWTKPTTVFWLCHSLGFYFMVHCSGHSIPLPRFQWNKFWDTKLDNKFYSSIQHIKQPGTLYLYLSHRTCPYSQCGISYRQMKTCCLHFWLLWLIAKGMNWYVYCSENENDLLVRMLCRRNSVDNGHYREFSHVLKIMSTHTSMLHKYKSNLGRKLYWELRIAF